MRNLFYSAFQFLFGLVSRGLDFLVPKSARIVVLGSHQGQVWSGNGKALFDYIQSNETGLEAFCYHRNSSDSNKTLRTPWSLKTAITLFRAKTLVVTHGLDDFYPYRFSKRKFIIQAWHGVPVKRQLFTESGPDSRQLKNAARAWRRYDRLIAPSSIAGHVLASSCLYDSRKIFYCGQPRNDPLLEAGPSQIRLRELLKIDFDVEKIVLYAPTFRRNRAVKFFPFEGFSENRLSSFMVKHKALVLLRGHIDDPALDVDRLSNRVRMFNSDVCADVNDVLKDVDVLITDYSSIYVDFLLLNRPMLFPLYDLDQFTVEHGLLYDDVDFWMPGAKPRTEAEFFTELAVAFKDPDKENEQRICVNRQLNYFQTADSCAPILEMIKNPAGCTLRPECVGVSR